jgi:integrase
MFHTQLIKDGLSEASADHHIKLLKRMYSLAIRWDVFAGPNPIVGVQMANPDNRREILLSEEELARLLQVLQTDPNRAVCAVARYLLFTGARLMEALSAKWEHIDLERRLWRIPAATSKSKRIRSVPLNDSALEVLTEVGTAGRHEYVFVNEQTKKPYTTVARVWNRLRRSAGLPRLRLHDLRHTHASVLCNAGVDLYAIAGFLGLADVSTTKRYAHLSAKTMHEASSQASQVFQRATKGAA